MGTDAKSSRVAWVKPVAEAVLARAGIATPEFVTLPQSLFREAGAEQVLTAIADHFGLPVVVKPARGGSALGVTLVTRKEDLAHALVHCFAYGDIAMIERAVTGTELAVSVLGEGETARALPGVEIVLRRPLRLRRALQPRQGRILCPRSPERLLADAVAEAALAVAELGA